MIEVDVEAQKFKYQTELLNFQTQLQRVEQQRTLLILAIQERKDFLILLDILDQLKPTKAKSVESKPGKSLPDAQERASEE